MMKYNSYTDPAVIEHLKNGGVVCGPTDTVWGLLSLASVAGATNLQACKNRSPDKPFITLVGSVAAALSRLGPAHQVLKERLQELWPGPVTGVFLDTTNQALSLRVPNHPELRVLADQVGPLYSTSANISGETVVTDIAAAATVFNDKVVYVTSDVPMSGTPSTIIDFRNLDEEKVLRP